MTIRFPTSRCRYLAEQILQENAPMLNRTYFSDVRPLGLFNVQDYRNLMLNHATRLACNHLGELFEQRPLVKLFAGNSHTWLLAELDFEDPTVGYGLCDLGTGFPEVGYVSLRELVEYTNSPSGHRYFHSIYKDKCFTPTQSLSAYAENAYAYNRIVA